MSTLAIALKNEICRLARKEIKAQTGRTARAVKQYRREIARLKRQLREQDRKIGYLANQTHGKQPSTSSVDHVNGDTRFSARSVHAQRRRTGLSAADYAKLIGVSPLTIYNWEHKKSRPRKQQFAALVALRGIGRREAQARLARLAARKANASPKRRRRKPK
jgi:DNA-binding transcriptional regulator YiaG